MRIIAPAVLFASSLAMAQTVDPQPPPPPKVTVAVGKKLEVDVGWARGGWFCDDTTLVTGELVTRKVGNGDRNFWIITGIKAGKTQCRVGHELQRASLLFDLTVTPTQTK